MSNKKSSYLKPTQYFQATILTFLGGVFLSLFFYWGFFSTSQLRLSDRLYSKTPKSPEIKIIAIDNQSIQKIGQWPFARKIHAQLINQLIKANPKVIGFDVAFLESTADDSILANSFKKAGNVVLPIELELTKDSRGKFSIKNVYQPVPSLREVTSQGITNTPIDKDGVLRKIPISINQSPRKKYDAFFIKILEKFYESKSFLDELKLDTNNNMVINFAGPPKTFDYLSYSQVLNGEVNLNQLKDKIVLIGATAPDLHDEQVVPTSHGQAMPGVEIHANALNTALTGQYLLNQPKEKTIFTIILLSVISGFLFAFFRALKSLLLLIFMIFTYLIYAIISFDTGLIVNLPFPIITLFLSYLIVLLYKYIIFGRERNRLKKSFSQYASPEIVEDILKSKELQLGGEKRYMTVLFSDIRGFTTISEQLPPDQLVNILNEYLSVMNQVIFKNKGIVDKFIGDAIMAFWNAPINQPQHAYLACQTALEMIDALKRLTQQPKYKQLPQLKMGIGINTGEMIAGNMGSNQRFDYTLIGDNVNLASRLEGLTKYYGVDIIISQSVVKELEKNKNIDKFTLRFLDKVVVKGKSQPVKIYELLPSNKSKKEFSLYQEGLTLLYQNKITEAKEKLKEFIQFYPDDQPTQLHLQRIQNIENGHVQWEGVYYLDKK